MLKTISSHIKDLYFIKQILYGCAGFFLVRNIDDVYTNVYLNKILNGNGYGVDNASLVLYKNINDLFNKKIVQYYKRCQEKAINLDHGYVSNTIYTSLGEERKGIFYFYPHKDKNNNIIGSISYSVEVNYLKKTADYLFKNNRDYNTRYLYYNLFSHRELFSEITKIISQIDSKNIINNSNINLIENLKNYLTILLNNLKHTYTSL